MKILALAGIILALLMAYRLGLEWERERVREIVEVWAPR